MAAQLLAAAATERRALVLCDLQYDSLRSLGDEKRAVLLRTTALGLNLARRAGWSIVFTGLRFPKGYSGVPPHHKLYGGLRRMNERVGDRAAHWFMEGFGGADIEASLLREGDVVVWRRHHLPAEELLDVLRGLGTTKAYLLGPKVGHAVQATAQVLCNEGILVAAVRDCCSDDDEDRLAAVLDHVLPVFADIISLAGLVDDTVGLERFLEDADAQSLSVLREAKAAAVEAAFPRASYGEKLYYFSDCKRGGHGPLYFKLLNERPEWRELPTETWYQDRATWKSFLCPLDRRVVDFADEPEFSRVSMFIKGRNWLDDKSTVVQLAHDVMPDTFSAKDGQWEGGRAPPFDDVEGARDAPWFVKAADRNWGTAIEVCRLPSEAAAICEAREGRFVVQQHVLNPLLTDDGRKAHIKFYALVVCAEDGVTWSLYTDRDGFLSISNNRWSAADLSTETQVTILRRHPTPASRTEGWKQHWPGAYESCKAGTATVIKRAVESGRLEGRPGKTQFEVLSADWIIDRDHRAWLLEFNFSPGLGQHGFAKDHDEALLRDALGLVLLRSPPGCWDPAGTFTFAGSE